MGRFVGVRRSVIVIVVLAFGACGGSGSGATPDTIAPSVADQLTADATVLQASDLPGAFQSSSSSASSSSSDDHGQQAQQADQCFESATGIKVSNSNRTGKASRTYATGTGVNALEVGAEVDVYRDDSGLHDQLLALSQPTVANCFKRAFVDAITGKSGTVADLTVVSSKVEGIGDEQAGFVLSGPVVVNGVTINFGGEFDFTRVGRVALTTSVLSLDGVPDHTVAVSAMKAMVGRLPT